MSEPIPAIPPPPLQLLPTLHPLSPEAPQTGKGLGDCYRKGEIPAIRIAPAHMEEPYDPSQEQQRSDNCL